MTTATSDKRIADPVDDPGDDAIARAAARFDVLIERRAAIESALGRLSERRLFVLALALDGPVGVPEIRAAVLSMKGSPRFPPLRRLQHGNVIYFVAQQLEDVDALERIKRGSRRFYRLRRSARAALRRVLGESRASRCA